MQGDLEILKDQLAGELFWDSIHRTIYSTDASVYKEEPKAVAFPKSIDDLQKLIHFAKKTGTSLVPRTAGTSLAGQVVGNGIIVDFSKHFNRIIELNTQEKWVWVEPGVVLDELNMYLRDFGLFFGPETSTGNRCMMGGMLGNNACGLHSLVRGSTRDHTLAVETLLSDGSVVIFEELSKRGYQEKLDEKSLEGDIYRTLNDILINPENQKEIINGYPDPEIPRRNTGYALDIVLNTEPFSPDTKPFNLSKLLAGSEGTLAISTRIKLNLIALPPSEKALICVHFNSLQESLLANLIAIETKPTAVELMDSAILDCARSNKSQLENSFFIDGRPKTILIIEHLAENQVLLQEKVKNTIDSIQEAGYGYSYPVVYGSDCSKVWNLRKAGLGLLANIPGDAKSVSVIEDTAVPVKNLPAYIGEVEELFKRMNMECVYHAHVGTGELHMRPLLNLKDSADIKRFHQIANEIVALVKKYRGSLSGEHGDGRLRAPFIPHILGEQNYELIKRVKKVFDPQNIFNPGKIVDAPPMDEFLRYEPEQHTPDIETVFDFSKDLGIIRSIEKCNGSGDCRKSHLIEGSMCPSYQATHDERNTTRARANTLREFISKPGGKNHFDHPEIYEILDLCLSCKACKSECPSSVDMAKLKGEFLQHWYDAHGIPFRTKLIANITTLNKIGSFWPGLTNTFLRNKGFGKAFKKVSGFAADRSLPEISAESTNKWAKRNLLRINPSDKSFKSEVCLFVDEFTDYNDANIGITAIKLLSALGYRVIIPPASQSGRSYISKGLLRKARKIANENVKFFSGLIDESLPLIGIEPSAILSFRDEYPDLVSEELKGPAKELSKRTFTIDEFIAQEIKAGKIDQNLFKDDSRHVRLHGHCQQKALASTASIRYILEFPKNYTIDEIPSGCCGMAGSFGYEKEHYELSMKVGELVLFPEVRQTADDILICAPGTSCRHQIKDGTGRKAYHPVEILYDALKNGEMGN